MERKTIKSRKDDIYLDVCNYENNNRLAILATKVKNGEYYGDITVNAPEICLLNNEVLLNDDFRNCAPSFIKKLRELGIIEESLGYARVNFSELEIVRIDFEKLKEYDPKGLEKALKNINKHYKI